MFSLDNYFIPLSKRSDRCTYFYRIPGISPDVTDFLKRFYTGAVVIEERIPNPDTNNLNYFSEMLGADFSVNKAFLSSKLQKWLPRLSPKAHDSIVQSMLGTFEDMRRAGKNDNIMRNSYMKFMCWMYYKFERILNQLGSDSPARIIYDGTPSTHELQLLSILFRAGADIVLLERNGDKADPHSQLYVADGLQPFPVTFRLQHLRLYGPAPKRNPCTNAWMSAPSLQQVLTPVAERSSSVGYFCNCFIVQYGVEDRASYANDLVAFRKQLGDQICVVEKSIPSPTPDEVATIRRRDCNTLDQLASSMLPNISYPDRPLATQAFLDILLEQTDDLRKAGTLAITLLCWLKRYQNYKVFLLFGQCASSTEAAFLRMLSKLPVDVVVLVPDLSKPCVLQDSRLLELRSEDSLSLDSFPTRTRTVAYQAERDLDTLMYQDSGMYRNHQYLKADTSTLQPIYEEIHILWDQEVKYRPGFVTSESSVTVPVLFERVCGIKDGNVKQYWASINKLLTPETLLLKSLSVATPAAVNTTPFLKNGRLQRDKLKASSAYTFGILREEMQNHLLDKLQLLLDQRIIEGTYKNGTEYTIISVVLGLSQNLLRMVQAFDFTRKNPKLVFINTGEQILSLADSILVAFLNLVGFDIVFYIPTGYQCTDKFFTSPILNEHQIGEYKYDLAIPDFNSLIMKGVFKLWR